MAEGEREGKLPTKGSGRQSRKHMVSEHVSVCALAFPHGLEQIMTNNVVRECKQ